jgi:hypothetical protein
MHATDTVDIVLDKEPNRAMTDNPLPYMQQQGSIGMGTKTRNIRWHPYL